MASYQNVSQLFWKDPKARKWSDACRSLALYLLTGPHANTEGLYWLPIDYVCADLSWTPKKAADTLDELERDGFCRRHDETETIIVVKALKYRTPSGEPQLKGAVKQVSEVPASPLFHIFRDSAERYAPELLPYLDKESDGTLSEHYRVPLDTPSGGVQPQSDTPSGGGEPSSDTPSKPQTPTQPHALALAHPQPPSSADDVAARFEAWWSSYPQRDGKPGGGGVKKPAREKWHKLTDRQRELAEAAVGHYREYVERPGSPHPKHAVTWLNQEAWEDWQSPASPNGRPRDGPAHNVSEFTESGRVRP